MILSDISVKRPVFATVLSLLIVALGILSYFELPLQENPDVELPFVSVETVYRGASAEIIDRRITELVEGAVGGIEGVKSISSTSRDGRSDVTLEFELWRNIDDAANDVRDAVSRVADNLPADTDPPEVGKFDVNARPSIIIPVTSSVLDRVALGDYIERYLLDQFATLPGVARARLLGSTYAMRIWLDRKALTARGLTVTDVERTLRSENLELPAGSIDSTARSFTVRVDRPYAEVEEFRRLVLGVGPNGALIRLGDVARVELGAEEEKFYNEGIFGPQVGIGLQRQSKANIVEMSEAAKTLVAELQPSLPEGMRILEGRNEADYVKEAIREVYLTLGYVLAIVILVIYLFLGSGRTAAIPALTVPVCLIGTFIVLAALGYSINLMTLLALVLSVGLVVDDAIVVLENVQRRIDEGEPPLVAAYNGTRQVGFAVIATTAVILAVFAPVIFLGGSLGPIFTELGVAISTAVALSSFVALTLSAALCGRMLKKRERQPLIARGVQSVFTRLASGYQASLRPVVDYPLFSVLFLLGTIAAAVWFFGALPRERAPQEDRGLFQLVGQGPEGASFETTVEKAEIVHGMMMDYVESGEVRIFFIRVPNSFGFTAEYNSFGGIVTLADPGDRIRSTEEIVAEINRKISTIPGVRGRGVVRSGFSGGSGGSSAPVQFVLGGPSYEALGQWRDLILARAAENPCLVSMQADYRETKPQFRVSIDLDRAADLGITVESIGRTLETLLGGRRVTTFINEGEERDVIVQMEEDSRREPSDLTNINVRSDRTGLLVPLSNLVDVREVGGATALNRYNRVRAVTLEASLGEGCALGSALDYLEDVVRRELPPGAQVDYKGESLDFREASGSLLFTFALALLVVFLVLAAQFESFVHPFIIMLTVPIAVAGGLGGLYFAGNTLNAYSQIGIVILIGLAAKNGILIVEFANQLRAGGLSIRDALFEAAATRLRPILMTGLSTAIGALPLVLAGGAGSEGRETIGLVIFWGVLVATAFTLYVVPVFYSLLARFTRPPGHADRVIAEWRAGSPPGTE
ncbi:MAG: efflux RND transporter permease subunit [Alphaproteobacteria bacterium]|nr:efflux RND transporter permease subunit [Alphaproteobacteria bacterium]